MKNKLACFTSKQFQPSLLFVGKAAALLFFRVPDIADEYFKWKNTLAYSSEMSANIFLFQVKKHSSLFFWDVNEIFYLKWKNTLAYSSEMLVKFFLFQVKKTL